MKHIAIFESAREVVRAERTVRENGLGAVVMPVPGEYSSECGMCLLLEDCDIEKVTELMRQNAIKIETYERKV